MKILRVITKLLWSLTGIVWAAIVFVTLRFIFVREFWFLKSLYTEYGKDIIWKKGKSKKDEWPWDAEHSIHPTSIIRTEPFGKEFTKAFRQRLILRRSPEEKHEFIKKVETMEV